MENKINIAELLKNCPKGMVLDCTMFDDITLLRVDDREYVTFPIILLREDGNSVILTKYGQCTNANSAKCVIFPKGKTTWDGFVPPCTFNSGDILHIDCTDEDDVEQHEYFFILDEICNNKIYSYCHYYIRDGLHPRKAYLADNKHPIRFASEEEKEKLFQAIKANGYKWNAETKNLEKLIAPKFKVGDKIKNKNSGTCDKVIKIFEDCYLVEGCFVDEQATIGFDIQDNWELVPDKFDITTLKPFDKVLMRDNYKQEWVISLFSHCNGLEICKYSCINGSGYSQCIPYEGNEHLLGTTDDCEEYYKTWEQ